MVEINTAFLQILDMITYIVCREMVKIKLDGDNDVKFKNRTQWK